MSIITQPELPESSAVDNEGYWTRQRVLTLVLLGVTLLAFVLCYLIIQPFVPVLAFALALAVVAHPLHDWISTKIHHREIAAGVSVVLVAIVIIGPAYFVAHNLVNEAAAGATAVRNEAENGALWDTIDRIPVIGSAVRWLWENIDVYAALRQAAAYLSQSAPQVLAGSAWAAMQLMLVLFTLYFFFRDQGKAIRAARSFMPLSEAETDELFKRVGDTVYATVYGTLFVALVQGTMGGLMFWWLGLPSPVMWGAIMSVLAVVPNLGAFVVWIPAAIILAAMGEYTKASVLAVWGAVAIGLIDNFLYPLLVGKRMRLHTLPVFFAIVGGLAFLGAAGVVIGPIILAVTVALVNVWRKRTALGQPAETAAPDGQDTIIKPSNLEVGK